MKSSGSILRVAHATARYLVTYLIALVLGTLVAIPGYLALLLFQDPKWRAAPELGPYVILVYVFLYFSCIVTPIPALLLYGIARLLRVTVRNYLLLGTVMALVVTLPATFLYHPDNSVFVAAFGWDYLKLFLCSCLPASLVGAMVFYKQARMQARSESRER